jgi:hypothetical protein
MAVATEYGKYFTAGSTGQFADSAKAASKTLGVNDKVARGGVKAGEPCTFERYVEIQTAQTCWATQGKDVNQMLKKVFNITVMDFSNLAAFWAQRMSTDAVLMTEVYPELEQKYRERYSGGGDDPDGDLSL